MSLFNLSILGTMLEIAIAMLALSGDLGATSYQILHDFGSGQDGTAPAASLTLAADGSLFGTTAAGGSFGNGTIFKLSYSAETGWTENLLHSFNYLVDGEFPDGVLTFDAAGNLYGTTPTMGPQRVGTVFELSPNGGGGISTCSMT
jgi:uncharacterized repeat protein (TIGR03803 family)